MTAIRTPHDPAIEWARQSHGDFCAKTLLMMYGVGVMVNATEIVSLTWDMVGLRIVALLVGGGVVTYWAGYFIARAIMRVVER